MAELKLAFVVISPLLGSLTIFSMVWVLVCLYKFKMTKPLHLFIGAHAVLQILIIIVEIIGFTLVCQVMVVSTLLLQPSLWILSLFLIIYITAVVWYPQRFGELFVKATKAVLVAVWLIPIPFFIGWLGSGSVSFGYDVSTECIVYHPSSVLYGAYYGPYLSIQIITLICFALLLGRIAKITDQARLFSFMFFVAGLWRFIPGLTYFIFTVVYGSVPQEVRLFGTIFYISEGLVIAILFTYQNNLLGSFIKSLRGMEQPGSTISEIGREQSEVA